MSDRTEGQLNSELVNALDAPPPWIVGILNITPDSFSDGAMFDSSEQAIDWAWKLKEAGAQIIDLGGESTGPDRSPVNAEEEYNRIVEVVDQTAGSLFVSVDTYKAEIAQKVLKLGVRMINDVSAMRADPGSAGRAREPSRKFRRRCSTSTPIWPLSTRPASPSETPLPRS